MELVPIELKARSQWVVWRYEKEGQSVAKDTEGATKIPYNAKTGHKASSTNPNTWAPFDIALKAAQTRGMAGVGFVFSKDDPFTGIDLDDCLDDTGALAPWAAAIVEAMSSYTEVSPSGHGLKIWVEGDIPTAVKTAQVEMYSTARYFTVTGDHFDATPTAIRNVNGALTDLYERLKPEPAPPALRLVAPAAAASDYTQAWARKVLARAIEMVTMASDGTKHDTLLAAARLAGGATPHISEWEIETALYAAVEGRAADKQGARRTIQDGIRMGAASPLPVPDPPPQPLFDGDGFACCPTHERRLSAAKNGNGYTCRERDASTASGWCDFWWKGEGYIEPRPAIVAGEVVSEHPSSIIEPTTKFRLYTIGGLRDLPPVTWLIESEIPAGLTTLICGPSQAGKSFVAVDYALRVARANPDRAVIYVAPEGGSGYRQRVDAWLNHFGGSEPKNILFILQTVTLLNPQTLGELVTTIQGFNPILVIIDTLARALVGGDENSAKDIGLFFYHTDLIREATHAAIAVVHHTGKAGAYRGSSAMYAAVDSWIDISNDDGLITVNCGKAKDWEPFAPRYLRMVKSLDSVVLLSSDQVSGRDGELTEPQRKILETLILDIFTEAGAKRNEIASASGINELTLYRVLSRLKRSGYISQSKKGDPYFITKAGTNAIKEYHRDLRLKRQAEELANEEPQQIAELANLQTTSNELVASSSHQLATSTNLHLYKRDASLQVASESELVASSELFPDDGQSLSTCRGCGAQFTDLGGHGLCDSCMVDRVNGAGELELDDPDDPAVAPEAPSGGLDWDFLRKMHALGDDEAIRRHCVIKRANVDAVRHLLKGG